MAQVIEGDLPEIFLLPTFTVTFAAISPVDGSEVSGVTVESVSITGDSVDPEDTKTLAALPPILSYVPH